MIDRSFFLSGLLILASGFSSAQTTGIEQNLEFLTPSTGGKYLRWYGDADRSYFLQISEPSDPLKTWFWAPLIEAGNDEDISFEVDGTADKGFFRLHYTNQLPGSGQTLENADFDGDGFSNLYEITLRPRPGGIVGFPTLSPNIQTNPLRTDTDSDGLSDVWEEDNGLDPTDNGSRNSNNGPNGDPDLDGLSNLYEYWSGADPQLADTDGDGINDLDEVTIHYTSPTSSDSDWDGLADFDEIFTHGTQPWIWDTDEDSLSDGDEVHIYLTNPLETDTDGDWMWDDYELANSLDPTDPADGMADADGDTLANQLEFVFLDQGFDPVAVNNASIFPWAGDPDLDGLNTQVEFVTHHTNPRQPDTDGDALDDAWELQFGFDALVNNLNDASADNDPTADPDGDGIDNEGESKIGTKPNDLDTDGDGVSDNVENNQGSNPNDPNDNQPPPNGTVPFNVTFGDPSDSHSEKYRIQLTPLEGDPGGLRYRSNRRYGQVQEDTLRLPKGAKYKIELIHIATNPRYRRTPRPDYDYSLEIDDSANGLVILDPQGIMGDHYESTSLFAAGKDATLHVPLFEWVTPKESPVTAPNDTSGNGQNEFTYDTTSPGVLTIDLKILVKPTGTATLTDRRGIKFSDRCYYSLPTITGSTFAWYVANTDGKSDAIGDHLLANATFTTLPALNNEFGLKKAAFECDAHVGTLPEADFEVFYNASEKNHPTGDPIHANWFHYYKQNVGGGSFTYDPTPGARSSSISDGGDSSIKIGDYVHFPGGEYINTTFSGGKLKASGWSATNKYYAHFEGILAHERQHANGQTNSGAPSDRDGDRLSNDFEDNISITDPDDPKSAASGVSGFGGFGDQEVYAGGPIEQVGVTGANTSQDWANPGTNHK